MTKTKPLTEYALEQELNRNRATAGWNIERKKCTLCGNLIFRPARCDPSVCARCEKQMPLEDFRIGPINR